MTTSRGNGITATPFSASGKGNGDGGAERGIVVADLHQEMTRSYMEYAMSVILGRAMPDVRDGLKPVHRRLLFAMHQLNLTPGGQYRKCARVVGEVLGKYHPHGDSAVYDALVRMAQTFSMSAPLVNGHGNFGSTDGDPAAAMRYTECKLTALSSDVFLADMGKETVGYVNNFDGSETEPLVLPARVPNLLVNGSAGIAVGMATNIPPHNLGEVVRALYILIKDPDARDEQLTDVVRAPDFPTGGRIMGTNGSRDMYLTGKGRIMIRACVHPEVVEVEGMGKRRGISRDAIVVTELPYQVNKAVLMSKIAEMVNEKKLEGVADLRDESDRNGTRIVIELKRDATMDVVLNNLYKKTQLQSSFSANVMALDGGRFPVRLTLRGALTKFLEFRRAIVRKRVMFELRKAEERFHIVQGYIVVQNNVDEVIAAIRSSVDSASAKEVLTRKFKLSLRQAEAVLGMQLRRLTSLEQSRLNEESATLQESIKNLGDILSQPAKVDEIIVTELEEIAARHSVPRRSTIVQSETEDMSSDDERSLFSNERSVITVTQQGYIKRMPTSAFESQNRGTRGKRGAGRMREGDKIARFLSCMSYDSLIAISKSGVAYQLPAHKVPLSSLNSRGVPIFQLIQAVTAGETLASVLAVTEYTDDQFLVLLTRNGFVKKTPVSVFESLNVRGKRIIALDEGDELKWVRHCTEMDSLLIASQRGYVLRFATDANNLRVTGRTSRGVRAIRLREGDGIADMDVIEGVDETEADEDEEDIGDNDVGDGEAVENGEDYAADSTYILAVTRLGTGKRVKASSFRLHRRGRKGMKAIKLAREGEDALVALQTCVSDDSVMVVTSDGTIVRTPVGNIPVQSRFSRGVRIQRLDERDTVAAVTVLPKILGVEEVEEESELEMERV